MSYGSYWIHDVSKEDSQRNEASDDSKAEETSH
jgi:hypothetical protein